MSPQTHLNYLRVTCYVIGFNVFDQIKILLYNNNNNSNNNTTNNKNNKNDDSG